MGGLADAAAGGLSDAAYLFIKDVNWTSNLFSKPIPRQSPQEVITPAGKMIAVGAAMDSKLLKAAAVRTIAPSRAFTPMGCSHPNRRQSRQPSAAWLHPCQSSRLGAFNSVGALVDPQVPAHLTSAVKEAAAKAAYEASIKFAKVVNADLILGRSLPPHQGS